MCSTALQQTEPEGPAWAEQRAFQSSLGAVSEGVGRCVHVSRRRGDREGRRGIGVSRVLRLLENWSFCPPLHPQPFRGLKTLHLGETLSFTKTRAPWKTQGRVVPSAG